VWTARINRGFFLYDITTGCRLVKTRHTPLGQKALRFETLTKHSVHRCCTGTQPPLALRYCAIRRRTKLPALHVRALISSRRRPTCARLGAGIFVCTCKLTGVGLSVPITRHDIKPRLPRPALDILVHVIRSTRRLTSKRQRSFSVFAGFGGFDFVANHQFADLAGGTAFAHVVCLGPFSDRLVGCGVLERRQAAKKPVKSQRRGERRPWRLRDDRAEVGTRKACEGTAGASAQPARHAARGGDLLRPR